MNWTMGPCARRSVELERLESPGISDDELHRLFDFWEWAGRYLGSYRIIRGFLAASAARWQAGRPISVLVLRCGRGDLAFSLANWFRQHRVETKILAVERYSRIVQMARDRNRGYPEIVFDTKDWRDSLFLQAEQFDYVVSSGALHHEGDEPATKFMKTVNRLSRRGFIVEDGMRDWRAYHALRRLGRLYGDDVSEDAGRSVLRSYTLQEAAKIAKAAGLDTADIKSRFWHRYSISSERGLEFSRELRPVAGLAGA